MSSQDVHSEKQHHIDMQVGDIASTVLIPGDPGRVEVFAKLMDEAHKVAEKREYITYTGTNGRVAISCTSTGLGCPPTAIGVEELIRIGARNIIRIGTCGAIQSFLAPGHFIIATGAVRGEHTSEEFISMEYPAVADYRIVRALVDACEKLGLPYHLGIVRTHDAYYLESPQALGDYMERLRPWIDMGVLALENESSTLFVISSMQGVRAGAILTSGNPIYTPNADDCDWDTNIRKMVMAGIEAAKLLHERGLA
ncbi:MAG TPA: nucleoside phosphorylase [Anaerolineae bacterium]|nr:nucleoside phosphorylase [Anaerolineae bacterium]